MKNFCEFLREHAIKIINFKKKKLKLLRKEKFQNKYLKDKKYHKARNHCHYTGEYRRATHM